MRVTKRLKIIQENFPKEAISIDRAVEIILNNAKLNFVASVDVCINLNIDATKADQKVSGTLRFPHETGQKRKIALIVNEETIKNYKDLGLDYVGGMDFVEKIAKEKFIDFDIVIASRDMMPHMRKVARILGPRGLMPTEKTGTVVDPSDINNVINEIKKGKLDFKNNKLGQIFVKIGNVRQPAVNIITNFNYLIEAIKKVKPATAKGTFLKKVVVNATMCPAIKILL